MKRVIREDRSRVEEDSGVSLGGGSSCGVGCSDCFCIGIGKNCGSFDLFRWGDDCDRSDCTSCNGLESGRGGLSINGWIICWRVSIFRLGDWLVLAGRVLPA